MAAGLAKLFYGLTTTPILVAEEPIVNVDVCIIWVMLGSVRLTYCQLSVASLVTVSEFCTDVQIVYVFPLA
jgi:hypothetical protein